MDRRLYVAACNGDVQALIELVREDQLMLFTATVATTSDNPLHIAALLGHDEFVKLAMAYNPKLSTEFNRYGYSPIHLASLKGHLQIVKDLVDMEKGLCVLKDCSEGKTALHCAAVRGRIDVIRHLLSCCPESAKELTFKSETMLHLVVKNSQGQIMTPLISILRELNLVGDLINCVDEDGNTVLHLATYRKQYQMIKVLLRDTNMNVNAVNADGYNASAISEMNNDASSSEFDNKRIIGEMIKQAQSLQRGGSSDQAHGQGANANSRRNEEQTVDVNSHGAGATASEPVDDDDDNEQLFSVDSIENGILIVCTLFATFCLEAILNLPGGFDREQLQSNPMNITADQLHKFQSFLISDVSCFYLSVVTIIMVTLLSPYHDYNWLHFNTIMLCGVMVSAAVLYSKVLLLTTSGHLADVAIKKGGLQFLVIMMTCHLNQVRKAGKSHCHINKSQQVNEVSTNFGHVIKETCMGIA
ncbi:hypothetical protein Ddye_006468 [Dipteronia dyeriana]|uniref:PGG domain-containing protein n=1 Tax=Dipteronia dyeriana TaxID=168575 RepID=A0AAE0CQK1_9ROSI|nr:hypothetical protein Ddye_006468 [Dipteronia dyeriana]